uniref:Uncharacterized protein n=1 Tax=Oncorhynchus tshawytscha TaxID=74940 RepID=A0AAZ3QNF1_ONCTS
QTTVCNSSCCGVAALCYGGGNIIIMSWGWQHYVMGCFAAGGSGALHKIDGIMRMEYYVDILKQHLKTSVRKLKLDAACLALP